MCSFFLVDNVRARKQLSETLTKAPGNHRGVNFVNSLSLEDLYPNHCLSDYDYDNAQQKRKWLKEWTEKRARLRVATHASS